MDVNTFNSITIEQKDLEEFQSLCLHYNVFPMDVPLYVDKNNYSNHPIGKKSNKILEEILDQINLMTEEEYESFVDSFPNNYKFLIDHDKHRGKLDKERVAINYLIARLYQVKFKLKKVINAKFENSEVYKIYPELNGCLDEDDLLKIDDRFILHDGGIEYKDHILHYNQFLRRGFSSNPNFDFTSRFIKFYNTTCKFNDFRIAIDFNRIMPKEFYTQYFEFDTWYGVPFDITRVDDPNEIGITVIGRNENSLFKLENKLVRTEFFWTYRNFTKTLQIEEISGLEGKLQNYYIHRYIHSQRDIKKKKFVHLDGAVKVYLENEYDKRYNSRIDNGIKAYKKIKLFRIDALKDGEIDLANWVDMISFFFKSNEMIVEYFNPEEFVKIFDERIRDYKKWKDGLDNDKQK